MELIADIRQIYDNYGFETKILTASIRHPMHMVEAALAGAGETPLRIGALTAGEGVAYKGALA